MNRWSEACGKLARNMFPFYFFIQLNKFSAAFTKDLLWEMACTHELIAQLGGSKNENGNTKDRIMNGETTREMKQKRETYKAQCVNQLDQRTSTNDSVIRTRPSLLISLTRSHYSLQYEISFIDSKILFCLRTGWMLELHSSQKRLQASDKIPLFLQLHWMTRWSLKNWLAQIRATPQHVEKIPKIP